MEKITVGERSFLEAEGAEKNGHLKHWSAVTTRKLHILRRSVQQRMEIC